MLIASIRRRAAHSSRQVLLALALAGFAASTPLLPAAGTATLVTSEVAGTSRSDFFGFVGMKFTVGSNPLTVTALGRYFSLTNNGTHTVKLAQVSDGADLPNATVSISMAGGTSNTYVYANLPVPVVLSPNTSYYLVSEEAGSTDLWNDLDTTVVVDPNFTCDGAVFIGSGFNWTLASGPDHAFGPMNLQYSLGPSAVLTTPSPIVHGGDNILLTAAVSDFTSSVAKVEYFEGANKLSETTSAPHQFSWNNVAPGVYQFRAIVTDNLGLTATSSVVNVTVLACEVSEDFITAFTLGSTRNNFSGPVGMKITVGPEPILITELGRIFVTGNSGTHTLKIVRVSDETDVPGSTVELPMEGGVDSQFKFATLPMPVPLAAQTAYYVVSIEVGGGDSWYSFDTAVTARPIATVDAPAFRTFEWAVTGNPNHSFVPVNFKYAPCGVTNVPPQISLAVSNGTSSFIAPATITLEATASDHNGSVTNVEFYVSGDVKIGQSSTPPYQVVWNNVAAGHYTLTARAIDNDGDATISAPITVDVELPPAQLLVTGSFNWGPVVIGNIVTQTCLVRNLGGQTLVGEVTTTDPFAIVAGNSFQVIPGATGQVSIVFTATNEGEFARPVVFTSNGGAATNVAQAIAVTPPQVSVGPESLDFGVVVLRSNAQASIVFTNSGGSTISNVTVMVGAGPFTIVQGASFDLGAFTTTNIVVRFAPVVAGLFSNVVTIASGGGDTFTIPVTGRGVAAANLLSKPAVTITAPAANARFFNPSVTVSGKATGKNEVQAVHIQVNGGEPLLATGTATWSRQVELVPGTNVLQVSCTDVLGNVSPVVTRRVVYVLTSPVHLTTVGNGTIVPNLDGQALEIGRGYTFTATPGPGQVFSNWTGTGASEMAKVTVLMSADLTLQATFAPNPFIELKGSYNGLFYDDENFGFQKAGFASFTVADSGKYTGYLLLAGKRLSFSGQFDLDGESIIIVPRVGDTSLELGLYLDRSGGEQITGIVNAGAWSANLRADKAVFSATNPVTNLAGKFTLVLQRDPEEENSQPVGDGFGTVVLSTAGQITFAGTLADGTKVSQRVAMSRQGYWPLYIPLYRNLGFLFGWMMFADSGPGARLHGEAGWIRPPQAGGKLYPEGLTNLLFATGWSYVAPTAGSKVVDLTEAVVIMTGGNLNEQILNNVTLGTDNKVTNLSSNKLTLTIALPTGLFSGTMQVPDSTQMLKFNGALLQGENSGFGFFVGTNQSGRIFFGQ